MTEHWKHKQPSRHQRGYGAAWDRLRKVILARDLGLCQMCKAEGRTTAGNHVDHITPKAQGGDDSPENLRLLCKSCHARASNEQRGFRTKPTIGEDGWPI